MSAPNKPVSMPLLFGSVKLFEKKKPKQGLRYVLTSGSSLNLDLSTLVESTDIAGQVVAMDENLESATK